MPLNTFNTLDSFDPRQGRWSPTSSPPRGKALTEAEIITEIGRLHDEWTDRVWLLREKTAAEIWRAALPILELRHLIEPAERWRSDLFEGEGVPVVEEAWQWSPSEILVRDYYANSLLTFQEVKKRGWPERKKKDAAVTAAIAAGVP